MFGFYRPGGGRFAAFAARRRLAGLALALAVLIASGQAQAQTASPAGPSTAEAVADVSARAEGAIRSGTVEVQTLETLRGEVAGLRDALAEATGRGDVAVRALQAEIAELPAPPGTDQTEPARIARERARLAEALAEADAPLLAQRQSLARLKALIADLDAQIRADQRAQTFARGPSALAPATWWLGLPEIVAALKRQMADMAQSAALPGRAEPMRAGGIFLALALPGGIVGWLLAGRGLAWIEASERGPGGRLRPWRVGLALILRAVVPLALVALAVAALTAPFRWPGHQPALMAQLGLAPLIVTAAVWLAQVLFAPRAPHRRIIALSDFAAAHAAALGLGLGLVVMLELLAEASLEVNRLGAEAGSLVALAILVLASALLWRLGGVLSGAARAGPASPATAGAGVETAGPARTAETAGRAGRHELRRVLARGLRGLALASLVALALGHAALARALIDPLLVSLWLIGLAVLAHRLVLRAVAWSHRLVGQAGPPADTAGAGQKLLSVALGAALALASVPLHALAWGARASDLRDGWLVLRGGVDLGGVRVSLSTVAVLLGVFVLGLILTRWAQKLLREDVLPNTRIDRGGQSAIVTGFGYAGVLVAALIAITLAGINLASLAIVAGALSVGIGFGLQAIVSNFVSGIILLIERPIKEGDLIQVAGNTGFVRKISVRATRIETPDGHDLIVPNADLITGLVRNMTLSSLSGRIELPIGVAYGSDLAKVGAILMEVARAHPSVLAYPAPMVLMTGAGDSSLALELRVFVRDIARGVIVRSELYLALVPALAAGGITIPFPVIEVHLPQAPPPGPPPAACPAAV